MRLNGNTGPARPRLASEPSTDRVTLVCWTTKEGEKKRGVLEQGLTVGDAYTALSKEGSNVRAVLPNQAKDSIINTDIYTP
jgi:hypothetical protein